MHRKLLLLAVVPLTTLAAGCCMCDAPYDYCGPTFLARPGEECCSDVRMNSAFAPYPVYAGPPEGVVIEGVAPATPGTPNATEMPEEASPSDTPRPTLPPDTQVPSVRSNEPSVSAPISTEAETAASPSPRGRPISFRR